MYDYDLLLELVESINCSESIKLLDDFAEHLKDSILKDLDLMSVDGELKSQTVLSGTHTFKIKYNGKCTLKSQAVIKKTICECFRLKKLSIIFKGAQEGCVTFVYQISSAVKSYLLQFQINDSAVAQLAIRKITHILIDDEELLKQQMQTVR